jgi:hypothetical protein
MNREELNRRVKSSTREQLEQMVISSMNALEHSLCNVESLIYMLPVDEEPVKLGSLQAWARRLRSAIKGEAWL